ncbi:MAG: UDP-N-acetylmuramoyl-L-alanyl-D-glutamate--2,6-diaminopimelate ligase [Syntrophales bacterium]|jgi:UDP-N-acetylmuramoyl-L-alanyl-D-glutamate--2,6-diaminopimelate ligase|nr:UDP-N-acetylmuramoyl-L-alanyl-D-glutamate--2,6-diaminopimelate ligase [Syntrophales bacterium]MCK9528613.1 UDP-N-acetylmuramoyl-L-alanyl-D-glutamate--2,6-diaminopimelate ligase [Syntrophales bacterium]MDX9923054.1 UDP-N-acetylmuramoyl-L-alanyl-D-glutamate--2,6-diaminopimelate ligase [Syntrophales bacterium]
MELARVLAGLPVIAVAGDLSRDVTQICYDSRRCSAGALFVALRGLLYDGHEYVSEALEKGARCVVHEKDIPHYRGVTTVRVADSRRALSTLAANFHGRPSKRLFVTGITGTNGKTTITCLLESILKAAGIKAGIIGTISCRYNDVELVSTHTTPESPDLQHMLETMADAGVSHVVMEVSSHAVDRDRVADVDFQRGVFTNLSSEHLDYHGSMEAYFSVKKRFFTELLKKNPAVVNSDDHWGRRLAAEIENPLVTYGIDGDRDVKTTAYSLTMDGMTAVVQSPRGSISLSSKLTGMFNLSNVLAAVALAITLDIPSSSIVAGIENAAVIPGRLERVPSRELSVFVDYAHTEDGLRNVLATLRAFEHSRLITVFGCGGDRDRTKRPLMGRTAVELSDCTVITSDNPRDENPAAIIREIEAGINGSTVRKATPSDPVVAEGKEYRIIEDRSEAIAWAIAAAVPGDIVLIAGKGHEEYQIIGNKRIPFDDRRVAVQCLRARGAGSES